MEAAMLVSPGSREALLLGEGGHRGFPGQLIGGLLEGPTQALRQQPLVSPLQKGQVKVQEPSGLGPLTHRPSQAPTKHTPASPDPTTPAEGDQ